MPIRRTGRLGRVCGDGVGRRRIDHRRGVRHRNARRRTGNHGGRRDDENEGRDPNRTSRRESPKTRPKASASVIGIRVRRGSYLITVADSAVVLSTCHRGGERSVNLMRVTEFRLSPIARMFIN